MTLDNDPTPAPDPAGEPPEAVRVLAIAGSLRTVSFNRMLLAEAKAYAPAGTDVTQWDDLQHIPPFSEDDEDRPDPTVRALRQAIEEADAVLIVTPEYNGSIPGQLKNALDWASRPFPDNSLRDKPAAVIGASPSPGGASRAQSEARTVLARIGAKVLDDGIEVPHAYQQFDPTGRLKVTSTTEELTALLSKLTAATKRRALAQMRHEHVEQISHTGTTEGVTIKGLPTVLLTYRGAKTGETRKTPVMRVEHHGRYAVVASKGGEATNPLWYTSVVADSHVHLQDGTAIAEYQAHEAFGDEKAEWWARAVDAYPDYAAYQSKTDRQIPLFVLEPVARADADGTASKACTAGHA